MRSPTTRLIPGTASGEGSVTPPPCPGNTNALMCFRLTSMCWELRPYPKGVDRAFYHKYAVLAAQVGTGATPRARGLAAPNKFFFKAPRRAAFRAAHAPGSGGC